MNGSGNDPLTWINDHLGIIAVVVLGLWLAGVVWRHIQRATRRAWSRIRRRP